MVEPRRFQIPLLYKRLLALALIIGPIGWLMGTEDGRRRTDLVALHLMGQPDVDLRLDILGAAATEQKVRAFLPELHWQCEDRAGAFGTHSCAAPIGSFDGTPAHYLVVYFTGDALQAMKVVYRARHHRWLTGELRRMLGAPTQTAAAVLQWTTSRGLVLLPVHVPPEAEQETLLWLSTDLARREAAGGPAEPAVAEGPGGASPRSPDRPLGGDPGVYRRAGTPQR
jgi:hypothetical protein